MFEAFHAYNPKNKRLRQVAAELSQLSHHIGLTDIDRRRVLNQRLVNIMPKTAHKLSLKHRLSQIGEGSDALELLHVVFSDKELLDEVEREWLSRPQQKIHQANFVDSSENNGERNKKEKYNNGRKKVGRDRCKKCGLYSFINVKITICNTTSCEVILRNMVLLNLNFFNKVSKTLKKYNFYLKTTLR